VNGSRAALAARILIDLDRNRTMGGSRSRNRLWLAVIGLLVVLGLGAVGCASLETRERELTFRVVHTEPSWFSGMPADVQELDLAVTADGKPQQVHAWWWPAADKDAPAVLYLHGTRWDLRGQLFRIEQLHEFGFSVLAIDYRGFGKSSGELPSEATVYEDAQLAWDRLVALQPDPSRRFIYGHSLGGAVAIDLASRLSAAPGSAAARGVIVESSFTTLAEIARALTVSWLPLDLILSQKFDSVHKIRDVHMPVLIVHGGDDRMVPSRFSQALYDAANAPKKLLIIDGATHNNSMRLGRDAYGEALHEMFGLDTAPSAQASVRSSGARF
jgi:alpha-beta hydrolase superfamily lysophospholipase